MSFYTQLMGRHFVEPSLQMEYSMISCCYHLVADTGISFPDMNLGMRQLHSPSYWTPSPPPSSRSPMANFHEFQTAITCMDLDDERSSLVTTSNKVIKVGALLL